MSNLAPFVAAVLRDKVVSELQKENEELREENKRFLLLQQVLSADLVTVTGPNSNPIYAYGRKDMSLDYKNSLSWLDVEEHIILRSEAPPFVPCPVQEISNAEIHFEGETRRLADCERTMCAQIHRGIVMYYYIFERFAPEVRLIVVVKFGPLPERASGLNIHAQDIDLQANPMRFQNEEIENVCFDYLAFCANFMDTDDEDDEE